MANVFIGTEAVSGGVLTRGQLRWNYRAIFPDVYMSKSACPTLIDRAVGAHLWSRRNGVVAGVAAAALHGAPWFDQRAPVEMVGRCGRPPAGITVRNEHIRPHEISSVRGISVTSPVRTAYDIARHLPRDPAVSHLDALAHRTGVSADDVWPLVDAHKGARGLRRAVIALSLMDARPATARQSRLRLALIDGGLPPPAFIELIADGAAAIRCMGYEIPKVGVVCGDPPLNALAAEWSIVYARSSDAPRFVADQVRAEITRRGFLRWRLHTRSPI
jgi:hypothetical protein